MAFDRWYGNRYSWWDQNFACFDEGLVYVLFLVTCFACTRGQIVDGLLDGDFLHLSLHHHHLLRDRGAPEDGKVFHQSALERLESMVVRVEL